MLLPNTRCRMRNNLNVFQWCSSVSWKTPSQWLWAHTANTFIWANKGLKIQYIASGSRQHLITHLFVFAFGTVSLKKDESCYNEECRGKPPSLPLLLVWGTSCCNSWECGNLGWWYYDLQSHVKLKHVDIFLLLIHTSLTHIQLFTSSF